MRALAPCLAGLLLAIPLSGCLSGDNEETSSEQDLRDAPFGWDEAPPAQSQLADRPYYDLTQSTSFLLKGWSYGRYIVRVAERVENVHLFFSTTNAMSTGRAPNVDDPDAYHFQFMQIRPLSREIREQNVEALQEFRHSEIEDVFTLTYIYGKGTNHQFLAPYDGDPDHWTLEPGFYEFVIASDEKLTVGINVRTKSLYWTTLYHPQELGQARAEALDFHSEVVEDFGGRLPDQAEELRGIVRAGSGERFNYFAFSDVFYETDALAVSAVGVAEVSVGEETVLQQLDVTSAEHAHDEAYAFAVHFDGRGPAEVDLRTALRFHEELSAQSTIVTLLMIFGVVFMPEETAPNLPAEFAA